jgi:hypothetical protein
MVRGPTAQKPPASLFPGAAFYLTSRAFVG